MGVPAVDAAASEGGADGGVGDAEALADAGEGFSLLVAGDGVVDFGVGESALFADGGAAGAEDGQDAGFGELPVGGELVDAGAGVVRVDDAGAVGVGEPPVQRAGYGSAGVVLWPVRGVIVVGGVDGADDVFGAVDQHGLFRVD